MNRKMATTDVKPQNKFGDFVTITLYALGIGAGAFVGFMGLLLVA